jgi:deoxycytidylate deaminase
MVNVLSESDYNYFLKLTEIENKSPCTKRKIGAILLNKSSYMIGYNYPSVRDDNITTDDTNETLIDVVHAEMDILTQLCKLNTMSTNNATLFLSSA